MFRAHDTRLGRDVAIKTLPAEFARDPQRLSRFQREAHTTKNRATQAFRFASQSLHNNQSYLGDYYRSQRARHGAPKAIKNTAHKLARIFYHLVTTRQHYDETVFAKLEMRQQQQRFRKLQSLANRMGYSLVEVHA